MRLWSLHPQYLDTKGLVALWREGLLAKHVLEGKTKGYRHHPQLNRFKMAGNPLSCINMYLSCVFEEAQKRGYNFDRGKIEWIHKNERITVTNGQMAFEAGHLLNKLYIRDKERYLKMASLKEIEPHPMFVVVEGEVEKWEITG